MSTTRHHNYHHYDLPERPPHEALREAWGLAALMALAALLGYATTLAVAGLAWLADQLAALLGL